MCSDDRPTTSRCRFRSASCPHLRALLEAVEGDPASVEDLAGDDARAASPDDADLFGGGHGGIYHDWQLASPGWGAPRRGVRRFTPGVRRARPVRTEAVPIGSTNNERNSDDQQDPLIPPLPRPVISCLALFLALAGSAFAAGVAKNSVRSAQIVDGTVRTVDLHDGAVNSAKDRGPTSRSSAREHRRERRLLSGGGTRFADRPRPRPQLGRLLGGHRPVPDRQRPRPGIGQRLTARLGVPALQLGDADRSRRKPERSVSPAPPESRSSPVAASPATSGSR